MNPYESKAATVEIPIEHPFKEMGRMFVRNKAALFGLGLLVVIIFSASVGPLLYPTDPFAMVTSPFSTRPGRIFVGYGLSGPGHPAGNYPRWKGHAPGGRGGGPLYGPDRDGLEGLWPDFTGAGWMRF